MGTTDQGDDFYRALQHNWNEKMKQEQERRARQQVANMGATPGVVYWPPGGTYPGKPEVVMITPKDAPLIREHYSFIIDGELKATVSDFSGPKSVALSFRSGRKNLVVQFDGQLHTLVAALEELALKLRMEL